MFRLFGALGMIAISAGVLGILDSGINLPAVFTLLSGAAIIGWIFGMIAESIKD